jgi:hypothetical protein
MNGDRDPHGDYPLCGGRGREESLPVSSSGDGAGNFAPRGDGDGRSIPYGEFPIVIPSYNM